MHESKLFKEIVDKGYCSGCGVCSSQSNGKISMCKDAEGKIQPIVVGNQGDSFADDFLATCPFSNEAENEDKIGKRIFEKQDGIKFNQNTGYYNGLFAGYTLDAELRNNGSSGGITTWLVEKLLTEKLIDGVIHVKEDKTGNAFFSYQISRTIDEIRMGSKSRYYPIEMSEIIKYVLENNGKYAIIGIPCFIKSVRLLANKNEVIKKRIIFMIGLVCGHLKSDFFAKTIGWELGIKPKDLHNIDFRVKFNNYSAAKYGVFVCGNKEGSYFENKAFNKDLYVSNWGYGFFKYESCDYCDDVVGETSDISIGDAWLPEYSDDQNGTNIIIIRNLFIRELIEKYRSQLFLEKLTLEKVYQSQAGGFRHRREGLAYRLYLKEKSNDWYPKKRIIPTKNLPKAKKNIYKYRILLRKESFIAYKLAIDLENFDEIRDRLDPLILKYNKLIHKSLLRFVPGSAVRLIKRIMRKSVT